MLYNDVKYRFCTQSSVAPPRTDSRVTAVSPVVKISPVRKKADQVLASPTVPEHMRVQPLSPGRVVAVRTRRVADAPAGEPRRLTPKDIARIVNEHKPAASKSTKQSKGLVVKAPAKKTAVLVKQTPARQKKTVQVVPVRGSVTPGKKVAPQPEHRKRSR